MSSLQKFHRRTQVSGGGPAMGWPATAIGGGDITRGFWLGTAGDGTSKLIAAPKSTEVQRTWSNSSIARNTTSTTDGVVNTTTLFNLGSAAHPAAYYCRALTTGGYNTWYLPAKDELNTCWSNHAALPFSTSNGYIVTGTGNYYWSSTELYAGNVGGQYFNETFWPGFQAGLPATTSYYVRAVRRTTV
jgi:hypothetical protein